MPDLKTKSELAGHALFTHIGAFKRYAESVLCPIPTHVAKALKLKVGQRFRMVVAEDGKSFTVSWK